MADPVAAILNNPIGKQVASLLGLPAPTQLRRHDPGAPLVPGPVLLGGNPDGRVAGVVADVLADADAEVVAIGDVDPSDDIELPGAATAEDGDGDGEGDASQQRQRFGALVLDVTGVPDVAGMARLFSFFHPSVRELATNARVVVLADVPGSDVRQAAAAQAVDGFVRSLAKELRNGATANLLRVHEGAEAGIDAPLRFLLSGRSAYVDGQPLTVGPAVEGQARPDVDWSRPLSGRTAVVTGAARGIGAAIARVLARDGANVVCLDLPAMGDQLSSVANEIGGSAFQLDITAPDAGKRLAHHVRERFGGLDVIVHNAGVTRDKTIVGMDRARWNMVLDVNVVAQQDIDDVLLGRDGSEPVLQAGGRIVGVASTSGIAGNRGQTNYAASKGAVIGRVRALADELVDDGITVNAVAPGFIETDMTDEMPFAVREVGRRLNSLNQGGRPVDVAEAIAFLASPRADMVRGQVLRVCGQSLVGA